MLDDAIGDLLPSALAVALSPIPIVAIVLVLGAPRARTAGPAFLLGWVAGLVAVAGAVLFYLISPGRAAGPLEALRRFMAQNNAVIMMVVLLLVGAKLLGDGFAGI